MILFSSSDYGFGIVMNSIKNSSLRNDDVESYVQHTTSYCKLLDLHTAKQAGIQFVKTIFLAYEKDKARRAHSELFHTRLPVLLY